MIRLSAPVRPPRPEAITATLDRLTNMARQHMPFGALSPADHAGLIRRTAQLCGVSVEMVKEVALG